MDNLKVVVKETHSFGKGLLAIKNIKKGEVIAEWIGDKIYEAESAMKLPTQEIRDHAIQFEEHKWIDTDGIGRYSNHSCEPNCGIKGKFQLVAIRDIRKGEWCTWDYEMTEDSDWVMECKCGTSSCRKKIGAFKNMPKDVRKKYNGYISDWLKEKYNLPFFY